MLLLLAVAISVLFLQTHLHRVTVVIVVAINCCLSNVAVTLGQFFMVRCFVFRPPQRVVSLADVSVLIIIFTAGILWVPLRKLQAQSQAFALSLPLLSLEVTLLGSELELSESGFTSCHLFSTKE